MCASQVTRAATERCTQDANARMASGGGEQTSACFSLGISLRTMCGLLTRRQHDASPGVLAKVKRSTDLGPDCAPIDT